MHKQESKIWQFQQKNLKKLEEKFDEINN